MGSQKPFAIQNVRGWSCLPVPPPGFLARAAVNFNTAEGYGRSDKGYRILRLIQSDPPSDANKGGGCFTHRDTDATQYPFYFFNGDVYRETGSGVSSLGLSVGDYFCPAFINSIAAGVSGLFFGDNTKAYGFRKETNLAAFLWDMDKPGGTVALSSASTGGDLSDGTHYVTLAQIDDTGARTVQSGPITTVSIVLSGGTSTQKISLDLTNGGAGGITFDSRATKYRVYYGTSDSPDAFFQVGADTAKATTSFDITDSTAGTALPHRNNIEQVAKLPIAAVDSAVMYLNRLIYASSTSNQWGWSEVADLNHYYSTSTDNQIDGPIMALGATDDAIYIFTPESIYQATGDLGRNSDYSVRLDVRQIESGDGCVSRASVVPVPGIGMFFMSSRGYPSVIVGSTVVRLSEESFRDYRDLLDFDYINRWCGVYNPVLRTYEVLVTRKTNTNYVADGAGTAGIADTRIRWNIDEQTYSPPAQLEATYLRTRPHPSSPGNTSLKTIVTAIGPHGAILELEYSYAHGVSGDVSGTDYDSKQPSSFAAEQATIPGTGLGDLQGVGLAFKYVSDDTSYPDEEFQRTCWKSSESGGNTTLFWKGSLPTPSGDSPSIRVAGYIRAADWWGAQLDPDPSVYTKVEHVTAVQSDVVGMEARS